VPIPMMSISCSDLMPIRAERSDAGLFQFETVIDISQEFSPSGIYKIVRRYTAAIVKTGSDGQPRRVSPHTWRHSTAVHLLEAGVERHTLLWPLPGDARGMAPMAGHEFRNICCQQAEWVPLVRPVKKNAASRNEKRGNIRRRTEPSQCRCDHRTSRLQAIAFSNRMIWITRRWPSEQWPASQPTTARPLPVPQPVQRRETAANRWRFRGRRSGTPSSRGQTRSRLRRRRRGDE
jgi:hypothetical protein